MYNIKLTDYVPEPKPATSDRVVAVHYYAAWKKGAAGLHRGFDDLHDYPERTPLWGYYDEENPAVTDFEIKWALEHGINCFVYCWYRLKENADRPVTRESLRCAHAIHEGLFHARYQNMMQFAIMYENSARWCGTNKKDLFENLLPYWFDTYFTRENYLKIDNKPVLFVCDKWRMDEDLGTPEESRAIFDACREYAKTRGFDGMVIACNVWDYNEARADMYADITARGYDFHFPYNAGYAPDYDFPPDEVIIREQCAMLDKRLAPDPMRHLPIATCFRDAAPRTTKAWMDLGFRFDTQRSYYLTPEGFREVIRRMKERVDALPDGAWGKRIFMIDNWNEWDEGHFVAPSHEFGFRYLQAIREELTARDNLPDYRTPADIGITGLNTSWEEPDFGPICEARLKAKK